jgi:hypothetical protein
VFFALFPPKNSTFMKKEIFLADFRAKLSGAGERA